MKDIDWQVVDWVATGTRMIGGLTPDEKRMIIRRLDEKMLDESDEFRAYGVEGKLSALTVADRLRTTTRSVHRLRSELPPATKRVCPVCHEPMWVLNTGVVEPHADRIYEKCEMSGQRLLSGLAAARPDLYAWAVTA